eukprot:TRINITY_DN1552_c0_g1_i3.p1 TRINITY_DN1552_c0_g1~~TRINITY_DN1552_c0_g1_i3.p1  ORF type:complete len:838 (+),score=52.99 TRINITY_DN1552_c0_g1_i3:218-2515(+)
MQEPPPQLKAWESYKWISPKAFYTGIPYSMANTVTPLKIASGAEARCPLLAAIAALALKPIRIQSLVSQASHSEIFYEVKLYYEGELRPVKVDHFFPHNPSTHSFVFTYSEARELWPMLIEKAYAKTVGSYQQMLTECNGLAKSFDVLTGFPTLLIRHKGKSKENIWRQIQKSSAKYYPIIARSGCTQCTVLELLEVEEKDVIEKYVKIFLWDKEFARKYPEFSCIKENDQDTIVYKVPFRVFLNVFQETAINQYRSDYTFTKTVRIAIPDRSLDSPHIFSANSSPKAAAASALMDTSGMYLIAIEAPGGYSAFSSVLLAGSGKPTVRYSVLLSFKQEDNGDIEYKENAPYKLQQVVNMAMGNKKKGYYYCLIKAEQEGGINSEIKFVIRGNSSSANLKEITERGKVKEILMDSIRSYATTKGVRNDISKTIYEYTFMNCLNIWLGKYFINETNDSTLITTFDVKKGTANFIPPYRGDKAIVRIGPSRTEYFMILWKKSEQPPVIAYHSYVQKSKEKILKEINEGTLNPDNKQEIAPGIFFVQYKHDCGMLFGILNRTRHMLYKGVHKFTLKNLTLEEEGCGTNEVKTVIPPESAAYKWAYTVDIFQKPEFSVEHDSTLETYSKESINLVNEMIKTGTMTKIGKFGAIWTKIIEDHWCMYVKNFSKKTMRVTIEVRKAVNLKCADGDKWEAVIKSGEGFVKRVQSKNLFNVSNCTWHAVFSFEQACYYEAFYYINLAHILIHMVLFNVCDMTIDYYTYEQNYMQM